MKRVLVTGTNGIADGIVKELSQDYSVVAVSRATGHDINDVHIWGHQFTDFDIVVNNAYQEWGQVKVLEFFHRFWKDDETKTIINIGSTVADYARTERDKDVCYMPYRLHKQALQSAFEKMSMVSRCSIKLINPGPTDTAMISHLQCKKLTTNDVATYVRFMIEVNRAKRLDLWE